MEQTELQELNTSQLQQHGFENSADLDYRVEVASRMARNQDADSVVLFDDTAYAVPESLRKLLHGLPGYERALYPGLLLATGFTEGATVIVAAPPNPVERGQLRLYHQMLEARLQRPVPFKILYEHDEKPHDLFQIPDRDYHQICHQYADRMNDPEQAQMFEASFHGEKLIQHKGSVIGKGRSLVVPFQTVPEHHDQLSSLIDDGQISLPDVPVIDKAVNNLLLRKHEFDHLPDLFVVSGQGDVIHDPKRVAELQDDPKLVPVSTDSIDRFALGVIDAIDRLAKQGKSAYVKLDSNGVSGLGNLDPSDYTEVYNPNTPESRRLQILREAIQEVSETHLPPTAVIEEFIDAGKIGGITQDYTICGQMVDGTFLPMSVNPVGTTKGVYDRQWTGPNAASIGEDENLWQEMYRAYADMGGIFSNYGYRNGILAGDIFVRQDGRLAQHDYNFRRGGRSTPEALLTLTPQGWFEAQGEAHTPGDMDNVEVFDRYTALCRKFVAMGMLPFSTSFGYFGKRPEGEQSFMKFKLLVPTDYFDKLNGHQIQRSEHLSIIQTLIEREAATLPNR